MTESLSPSSPNDPLIGQKIDGRYLIVSLLGSGASGRVYKAQHILLDGFVAIKILSPTLTPSDIDLQRFQKEASVLNSLIHPNIVKFLAFGNSDKFGHYMVLEFIEGETLAQRIEKKGVLSLEQASTVFRDICNALEFAHSHGVLHRDLKPANIILLDEPEFQAKLLDFGIFKDMAATGQNLTKTGVMLGSADYMSPEQCRSESLDLRSDIYSMGCVMYETLVGRAPMHDDNELIVMQNHLNKQIKEVPAKYGISRELQKVILRCLENNKEKRFGSAQELMLALTDAVRAPIGMSRRTAESVRRSAALIVALLTLVVATVGVSSLITKRKPAQLVIGTAGSIRRRNKVPETAESAAGCAELRNFIMENIGDEKFDSRTLVSAFGTLKDKSDPLGLAVPKDLGMQLEKRIQNDIAKETRKNLYPHRIRDLYESLAEIQIKLLQHQAAINTSTQLLTRWSDEDDGFYRNKLCRLYSQIGGQYAQLGDEVNHVKYLKKALDQAIACDAVQEIISEYLNLADSADGKVARDNVLKAYNYAMHRISEKGDLEPSDVVHIAQRMNYLSEYQNVLNLTHAIAPRIVLSVTRDRIFSSENAIGSKVMDKSGDYIENAKLLFEEAVAYRRMHKYKDAEKTLLAVLKFFDKNDLATFQYADFSCELFCTLESEKREAEIPALANRMLEKMSKQVGDVYVLSLIKLLRFSHALSPEQRAKLGLEEKVRLADEKYAQACPKPCEKMLEALDLLQHASESTSLKATGKS